MVTANCKCSLRRLANSPTMVGLACCCHTKVFIITVEYGDFSLAHVQLICKPFPFPQRGRDGIVYLNSRLDVGAIGEIKRKVHRKKTNYENVPFP